jgi:hypothetical protein
MVKPPRRPMIALLALVASRPNLRTHLSAFCSEPVTLVLPAVCWTISEGRIRAPMSHRCHILCDTERVHVTLDVRDLDR